MNRSSENPRLAQASRILLLVAALTPASVQGQITWSADPTQPRPPVSDAYRMVATSNGIILFGGLPTASTWRYRNGAWTQLQTSSHPSARSNFAMAYDADRGEVVLFGGFVHRTALTDETWTFDGSDWTLESPRTSPPQRQRSAMAFHPGRGQTVMFGGSSSRSQLLGDTWIWNGADWQELQPAVSPAARVQHAMAFSPPLGRVLMFGGSDTFGVLNDTWMYDGFRWIRHAADARPPGRIRHSLTHFVGRSRVVLHGGSVNDQNLLSDTWEFGLGGWIETTPTVRGPAVHDHASAFDADTGRVLIFGGAEPRPSPSGTSFPAPSDQFHRYDTTVNSGFEQMTTSFCGAIARLRIQSRPLVGNSEFRFFSDASPIFFDKPFVAFLAPGFSATPARLGPCDLHLTGVVEPILSQQVFSGSFQLPIPNDRALAGAQLYVQTTGPADGPFNGFQGFGLSPTYRITVGD